MKYTLDTIPVLDAYREDCECPLCRLRIRCEDQYVDSMLGAAYMEPDCRVKTNETGFCTRHFSLMYERRNRLGLALMTHTHMLEVIKSMEKLLSGDGGASRGGLLSSLRGSASLGGTPQAIRARIGGCVICEQVDASIRRYAYTIAQLAFTNAEFRGMLEKSKGFCLPHLALVLEMSEQTLSAKQAAEFKKLAGELSLANLRRVAGELEWFTLKFDYRNQDKPWGNSRDAVERGINKLMGACVGEEAQMPPHND